VNHDSIKGLAKERGIKIASLLALAQKNDPFFAGAEAKKRDAKWFVEIWERFSFATGVHLRRIHYRIVSDKQSTLLPSGKPYENTLECWDFMTEASKHARYLGLVDPASFVDRRNAEPRIYSASRIAPRPAVHFSGDPDEWSLPSLDLDLQCQLELPVPVVEGYDYSDDHADQRYFLQVWIEKSTMDDVLEPICRRYGVDLVTGAGFQSITSVVSMLRERNPLRKPARIFYISDFDPAGENMPTATARQIEFWLPQYAPDLEIKLHHLALTKEQVLQYELPRTPIKESDLRRRGFEERNGTGAVELDALEAIHPGELANIVTEAVQQYFDSDLPENLNEAQDEANDTVEEEWDTEIEPEAEERESIRTQAEAIAEKYADQLAPLKQKFDEEMEPLRDRMETLRQAVQDKQVEFSANVPARPKPAESDADESDWLFDSNRDYEEQIEYYHRHKEPA
jgi:hypothetical protein